jgi:L-galactose dehydrogenase/L-glyceraldehyde 3-phosphate reductase
MELRAFGNTGLEISSIVFGAGAVGGGVFRGDEAQRLEAVRRAREGGINWIDTAPGYGDGQSEENLGWILEQLEWQPNLSTKLRLRAEELDDIPGAARRSIEASLGRMRQRAVQVIQLHNRVRRERDLENGALGIDDVLGPGGVADAFDELREAGFAWFSGFTAFGDVDVLHELVASGRFQAMQAYHNLLNPSMTRPLPPAFSAENYRELARAASERGIGVLNIRVLAAGALGGQPARSGGFAMSPGSEPDRDLGRAALVNEAFEGEPGTPAQRAIRFALGRPGIAGVLVGFSNPDQVDEAVAATELPPLSDGALERLEALYESDFAR